MADPALNAACDAYLLGRGLPRTAPDVAALAAFVEAQAPRLSAAVLHQAEAVMDSGLARQMRRPSR